MKIQLGDFGNVVGEGRRGADTSAIGRAVEGLGNTVAGIATELQAERRAQARAKADNAALSYELEVKQRAARISDDLATGALDPDQAMRRYQDETAQLEEPQIEHLDPIATESLARARQRISAATGMDVERVANVARRRNYQSQFVTALDTLGKQAGLPGADIEAINARADAFQELGRNAGIPPDQISKAVQDFKDRNWLNQATGRAMQARNSLPELEALARDLSAADGYYANKLDTDKRNAVLRGVQADQDRIRARQENLALRNEARADRVLAEIDRQIASGVPATPEMWRTWAGKVAGTSAASEFQARMDDEAEVQRVLRSPIDEQLRLVQEKEAKLLRDGGSIAELANVNRLRNAVQRSTQQLTQAPLLFAEERLGADVQPIQLERLLQPGGASEVAAVLGERAAQIAALQKQYGAAVQLRPLLPQEAQTLAGILEDASPTQASQFYSALRQASGGEDVFRAAMQQIAPDSPIKAIAGILSSKQRQTTLERNWIADDVVASSRDVATTLLQGERILNRSKSDKKEDGTPQARLFLPEAKSLQAEFQGQVGAAFAGRPGAAEIAFQAVQAYYVGKAAQTGRLAADSQDIDSKLMREAVTATLGTVVDYNGNGEVLAPWGMDEGEFQDRIETALRVKAREHNLPQPLDVGSSAFGLTNAGREGQYALTIGRQLVLDAKGNPITVDIASNDASDRRGVIPRGSSK